MVFIYFLILDFFIVYFDRKSRDCYYTKYFDSIYYYLFCTYLLDCSTFKCIFALVLMMYPHIHTPQSTPPPPILDLHNICRLSLFTNVIQHIGIHIYIYTINNSSDYDSIHIQQIDITQI